VESQEHNKAKPDRDSSQSLLPSSAGLPCETVAHNTTQLMAPVRQSTWPPPRLTLHLSSTSPRYCTITSLHISSTSITTLQRSQEVVLDSFRIVFERFEGFWE
jgi:hypothetical protein